MKRVSGLRAPSRYVATGFAGHNRVLVIEFKVEDLARLYVPAYRDFWGLTVVPNTPHLGAALYEPYPEREPTLWQKLYVVCEDAIREPFENSKHPYFVGFGPHETSLSSMTYFHVLREHVGISRP